MAQVTYRANLSARSFPFLSENWGRTVIVPQYDNTFSRQLSPQEDTDRDVGVPQIYYCHNVMPHQQGFQSVGYETVQNRILGEFFAGRFLVRDDAGNSVYLGYTPANRIFAQISGVWTYITTLTAGQITYAYVSGVTYIYVANLGCYKFDFGTNTLVPVTLTGLTPSTILGVTYSAGYLIAWNKSATFWSSTLDPTDFTPSLVTGAGGGPLEAARGTIVACVAHIQGFIVYTTNNAVAAIYTGNSRYPFNFREIVASGGLSSINLIALDANSGNHFAYTTSGLQLISTTQTQTLFPDVTDFISGRLFEDYHETTDTLFSLPVTSTLQKRITTVSDRYLVISYGVTSLTHALVHDLSTKRWGKLKIDHVECFEYTIPSSTVIEVPRQSIAFLQYDGTIKTVDFSVTSSSSSGVIVLGKYQYVRARLLQLNEIHLENVQATSTFKLLINTALDGKNTVNTTPTLLNSSGLYRHYGCRAVGTNHSITLKGGFSVVSLVLNFSVDGKR